MVGICGNDPELLFQHSRHEQRVRGDLPTSPVMTLVLIKLNKIRFDIMRYQRARILIVHEEIVRGTVFYPQAIGSWSNVRCKTLAKSAKKDFIRQSLLKRKLVYNQIE